MGEGTAGGGGGGRTRGGLGAMLAQWGLPPLCPFAHLENGGPGVALGLLPPPVGCRFPRRPAGGGRRLPGSCCCRELSRRGARFLYIFSSTAGPNRPAALSPHRLASSLLLFVPRRGRAPPAPRAAGGHGAAASKGWPQPGPTHTAAPGTWGVVPPAAPPPPRPAPLTLWGERAGYGWGARPGGRRPACPRRVPRPEGATAYPSPPSTPRSPAGGAALPLGAPGPSQRAAPPQGTVTAGAAMRAAAPRPPPPTLWARRRRRCHHTAARGREQEVAGAWGCLPPSPPTATPAPPRRRHPSPTPAVPLQPPAPPRRREG